jgi:phospholipid/cholesterol/gamma-HCH transport system permease protein
VATSEARGARRLRETGEFVEFSAGSLAGAVGAPRYLSEVLRQAAEMIRSTWFLMLSMQVFFGMAVVNFGYFLLRALGASDYMGLVSGYATPRQTATTMFAYVFAGKVCSGFAAELAAMRINQEIDAYESEGVDPMRYVVGTRLLAVLVFVPFGATLSLVGQLIGVYLQSVVVLHGISPVQLLDVHWGIQTLADQLRAGVIMTVLAVTCASISCFYGMRARGGPANVGTAVSRSLYVNLVAVHLIAAFFAVLFWGTDLHIPIGG